MRQPPTWMREHFDHYFATCGAPVSPYMHAAELAAFIRWARRGVVVQGGRLQHDCGAVLDAGTILHKAEALGWISRQAYEPTIEQQWGCNAFPVGHPHALFSWEVAIDCPIYSTAADQLVAGFGQRIEVLLCWLRWVAIGCPIYAPIPTQEERMLDRALVTLKMCAEIEAAILARATAGS